MNGLYSLLLFLFVFGAVTGAINSLGVFDTAIPTNGAQLNTSTVRDIQAGSENTPIFFLNYVMVAVAFLKVIGAGVLAMFLVAPLIYQIFTMMGMDAVTAGAISLMIQAPITFVTLFGLFEWWSGRQVT
jgi:hypothetical protein